MKKNFARILTLILALAMMFTLVACSTPAEEPATSEAAATDTADTADGEMITLNFLHKWPQPEYVGYFDEVVAAFEEQNPNIDIVVEAVADEPIKDKLRIIMGDAEGRPDIYFSWSGEFARNFIAEGAALDLTEYMAGEWQDSLMVAAVEPFTVDGAVYGVPLRLNTKFFVYNQEIFDANGLTAPTTWDEFMEVNETLLQAGVTPIAFGNQYPWAACHYITGLNQKLVSQDTRMADHNQSTGEFVDAGYVQALDMFKELNDNGYFNEFPNSITHDMANEAFAQGQTAMIYVELEEFLKINTNMDGTPWGFFPMPAIEEGAGDQGFLVGSPDGFMVSSTTEHPEEAVAFLQFITNAENADKLVTMLGWPSPVIGAVNESNSEDYLVEGMKATEEATGMALWLDTDIDIRISDVYLPGLQDLLNGDTTSEDLMADVQEITATVKAEEG